VASSKSNLEANELRRRGRHRLIGAVVLVLLLVVFVPMLLDSEPRTARDTPALAIPPKDSAPPLPAPAAPAPAAVAAPAAPAATTPEVKAAEVSKVEVPKAPPAAVVQPQSSPAAARAGFVVQVGAFRDEAKLRQAQGKLQGAGVVHYTERLEGKGGALTRLRAGPYATREQAEAAQVAIKRASLDGKVIPLP
jgi:DedD protein